MLPPLEVKPEVVLVTGAGRGLGRALALELSARGLAVAALGRKLEDLEPLAAEAAGGQILPVQGDVADADSLRRAFARIDVALGPVDTLINNAAVYPHRDFLEETPDSFQQVMAVNLGGVVSTSLLALERMTKVGAGRIVNVATFADINPAPMSSAYSVSKGAARIFTRAMIADLADRFPNIVINDWIPGVLSTKMGLPIGHTPQEAARWGATLALWRDPDLTGTIFNEAAEHLPPQSFKRRLWNKLSGHNVEPRNLAQYST